MKDKIEIPNPQLNLIAGTTPAWLGGTLPETAWAEGFSSRLLLIYSGVRVRVDMFAERPDQSALEKLVQEDLAAIHSMYGAFSMEPAFKELFQGWYVKDCPPIPTHPKLEHYLPRRHIHFLKLCMVMSAARANDYVLRVEDYQHAMDFFLEAEGHMADVFKAVRSGADINVIDEAYNFVYTIYIKEKAPVPEHRIIRFLSERMPSHSVAKVLEVMCQSGMLEVASVGTALGGRNSYKPAAKQTF